MNTYPGAPIALGSAGSVTVYVDPMCTTPAQVYDMNGAALLPSLVPVGGNGQLVQFQAAETLLYAVDSTGEVVVLWPANTTGLWAPAGSGGSWNYVLVDDGDTYQAAPGDFVIVSTPGLTVIPPDPTDAGTFAVWDGNGGTQVGPGILAPGGGTVAISLELFDTAIFYAPGDGFGAWLMVGGTEPHAATVDSQIIFNGMGDFNAGARDHRTIDSPDSASPGTANLVVTSGPIVLAEAEALTFAVDIGGLSVLSADALDLSARISVVSLDGMQIATASGTGSIAEDASSGSLTGWDFTAVTGDDLTSPDDFQIASTAGGLFIATMFVSLGPD